MLLHDRFFGHINTQKLFRRFAANYLRIFLVFIISLYGHLTLSHAQIVQANAGPDQLISSGDTVRLDGTSSILQDENGHELVYEWSVISAPDGAEVELNDLARPIFIADIDGLYEFELSVIGPSGTRSSDTVLVSTTGVPPIANAGMDRSITLDERTFLDGTASNSLAGSELSYSWELVSRPEGSLAVLDGALGPLPSFSPDLDGEYIAELTVTDVFGLTSATDRVILSTSNLAPVAHIVEVGSVALNQRVLLDPSGTYDPNGDQLILGWQLLNKPNASTASLEVIEPGGQVSITPDLIGDYVVQLIVQDGDGAIGVDSVTVSSKANISILNPVIFNTNPVSEAGVNMLVPVNDTVELSGFSSYDLDGDLLTYRWSVLSSPDGSEIALEGSTDAATSFVPDLEGTYVVQLIVEDQVGGISLDTVIVSTEEELAPVPNIDGAFLLNEGQTSLDGTSSFDPDNAPGPLTFQWSALSLSTNFEAPEPNESPSLSGGSALDVMSRYGLVVFEDLDSGVDIRGRTLVGGNVVGNSSTYGSRILDGSRDDILTVVGNIQGGPKNINNGYNVRVGGETQTQINLNGGGQLVTGADVTIGAEQAALMSLSDGLSGLEANSTASIPEPNGQHGPARLNAAPSDEGVAVFNVDGNRLFSNDRVQQIEVFDNGAETIIVNVSGQNINFNRGNFSGQVQQDNLRRKIIWNFHEATDLRFERQFNGAVLAPSANLFNQSQIEGTVYVRSMTARASLGLPGFNGQGLEFENETDDTRFDAIGLVQLSVDDGSGLAPIVTSQLLSSGNVRPVGSISSSTSNNVVNIGDTIRLDANLSFDENGDSLTYAWSLLSRPAVSDVILDQTGDNNIEFIADASGLYIIQLIVSDGEYASRPVTFAVNLQNQPPIADAGEDQSVFIGSEAVLSAAGSNDPEGSELTYAWEFTSRPAGSIAVLNDATLLEPSFVVDIRGTYVLELVVNDGFQSSDADSVTVDVLNRAPIAQVSGDLEGRLGQTLVANGVASSDPDGDALIYNWVLEAPAGSTATLSNPNAVSPMYVADVVGSYTLTLIVSDGELSSAPVEITSSVIGGNLPPVLASVENQIVAVGSTLSLQLQGSDPDGDVLSYLVSPLPLPEGAMLDASTGIFTYTPSLDGPETLDFTFSVSDGLVTVRQSFDVTVDRTELVQNTSREDTAISASFWRILVNQTANPNDRVSLGELTFRERITEVNRIEPNRAVVSSTLRNTRAENLIDGDLNTTWAASPAAPGEWAGAMFNNPVAVSVIDVSAQNSRFGPSEAPVDFDLQYSNDGKNWTSLTNFTTSSDWLAGETRTFVYGDNEPLDEITSFSGRVISDTDGQPVADAIVMVGGNQTITNENGFFLLTGLEAGENFVMVMPNSETSNLTQLGSRQFTVNLESNITTTHPNDIRLPRIAGSASISEFGDTIVESDLFGISVALPQDSTIQQAPFASYWRVLVNQVASPGFRLSIGELAFRDLGNEDIGLSLPSRAIVSSALSNTQPSFLNDRNPNTTWAANDPIQFPEWAGVFFAEPVSVFSVDISAQNNTSNGPPEAPIDFDLEYSLDGEIWITVDSFTTSPDWGAGETRNFSITTGFADQVQISDIGADQIDSLPDEITPCSFFAIEPKSLVINQPFLVRAANYDGLAANTPVDLLALGPNGLNFIASGSVSEDGQSIEVITPNYVGGTPLAFAPRISTSVENAADQPDSKYFPSLLGEGNYSTAIALPSYYSQGQNRGLSFVYNSTAASPNPIVASESTFPTNGVQSLSSQVNLDGVTFASANMTDMPTANGQTASARQALTFNAELLDTGVYNYSFMTINQLGCSRISQDVEGEVFVDNQVDSPYGRGWSIVEVSRLNVQEDGTVTIREGNGEIGQYMPETNFASLQEPIELPLVGPQDGFSRDLDSDGDEDIIWANPEAGAIAFFENLGEGEFASPHFVEFGRVADIPPAGTFVPDITDISLADLDGDNNIDIVFGSQLTDGIFIIYGTGEVNGFSEAISIDGSQVSAVTTGDFNGDGLVDIMGTNVSGLNFSTDEYYRNLGNREFAAGVRRTGSFDFFRNNALEGRTADLNNDGIDDAIFRRRNGVQIFLGQPGDTLPRFARNIGGINSNDNLGNFLAFIDLDDNDLIDIIVGDGDEDTLRILLNQTDVSQTTTVTFDPLVNLNDPNVPLSELTQGDVNGDGVDDVLSASGNNVVVFRSTDQGLLDVGEVIDTAFQFSSPMIGDLNGDGSLDIIGDSPADDVLRVYFSDPTEAVRFIDPLTDFSELSRNDDGTFQRRFTNGTLIDYDVDGLQTAVTDRNGNVTQYTYDDQERVETITDPEGLVTTFEYGANDRLSQIFYPDGRIAQWEYDALGNLIRFENVNADEQMFTYDESGRMTSETNARGFTTDHQYGPFGRYDGSVLPDGTAVNINVAKTLGLPDLGGDTSQFVPADDRTTTVTDGRGNVTETIVNEFGSPIMVTDPIGRVTLFERDRNNLVTAMIEPSSVTTDGTLRSEFEYDVRGHVTLKREAVGTDLERRMIYEYEPVYSKVTRMVDYDGFETTRTYDSFGNMLTETDPEGGTTIYAYDSRGLAEVMIDERGNESNYAYDEFGREAVMIDASGTVMTYTRDDAGNVLVMTEDAEGPMERQNIYTYDEKNRKLTHLAPDDGLTQYSYDGNNNVTSVTDPTGVIETREYDNRDRLSVVNDPVTGSTGFEYDPDSNILSTTDALGEVTTFDWDAVDRMTRSVDALQFVRAFTYDLRDNRTLVTDGRGNSTSFAYDALDRAVTRTNPLDESWSFAYDLRDNRITSTKPDGVTLSSAYDGLSRMTSLTSSTPPGGIGAVTRNYDYDAYDNLTSANDNLDGSDGVVLDFTYDQENRVSMATTSNLFGQGGVNNIHSITYDEHDRRADMTDSFGGTTRYGYDPVDRLTVVTTPQGDNFEVSYDLAGRTLARTAPNVSNITRSYEPLTGRLSRYTQTVNGADFNDFTYAYTARGNIASILEGGEITRTRDYSYDAIERLTELSVPDSPNEDESYTLDEEGNRLSSHRSDAHVTNSANRLTDDDDFTYVYDLNGNLIQKLGKAGTGNPDWTYHFTALDELLQVERDGALVESYAYDAFGRRTRIETANDTGSTNSGATVLGIINDGVDRAVDVIDSGGLTNAIRRYTHADAVDMPLQVETFDSQGFYDQRFVYHADHLGSIRFITDMSGNIINRYDYDSYGNPIMELAAIDQPFTYTGREWDAITELFHYRARYYDANMGRFISEDPIGFSSGDYNIYRYVSSNPIMGKDPTGLSTTAEAGQLQRQAVNGARLEAMRRIGCSVSNSLSFAASALGGAIAGGEYKGRVQVGPCVSLAVFNVIPRDRAVSTFVHGDGGSGDCTPEQKNKLQRKMEEVCGSAFACKGTDNLSLRISKIAAHNLCALAQYRLNNICFRGGDEGHKNKLSQREAAIKKCHSLEVLGK